MAVPKRQQWGSRWHLTQIIAALAVMISLAVLLKLSAVSKCDQDVNMAKIENKHPNQLNGPKTQTPSLSSRQSYGFLDDIPDDSWKLLQERARASTSYANPDNPEEGHQYSNVHWYLNNLQVRERLRVVRAKVLVPDQCNHMGAYHSHY
jgi:hypothetical protein